MYSRRKWIPLKYIVKLKKKNNYVSDLVRTSLVAQTVKCLAYNAGDLGSIPGSGPLQYSCLENPMDGEAWWTTVRGVAKSRTRLSNFTSLCDLLSKPS